LAFEIRRKNLGKIHLYALGSCSPAPRKLPHWQQFLLNPLGKTPISFAIMEEGYLIYNFVVQWKAQFSFKIQRK
jgi:hypothetical protein